MSNSPEAGPETFREQTIADFFHSKIDGIIADNQEYAMVAWLTTQKRATVLHLIDRRQQPRTPIAYHVAYKLEDTQSHDITYGIFVANPWQRRLAPLLSEMPTESRHYFDASRHAIARKETRTYKHVTYDFLQGLAIVPTDSDDPEYVATLMTFHDDLRRLHQSNPLKPESVVFKNFIVK